MAFCCCVCRPPDTDRCVEFLIINVNMYCFCTQSFLTIKNPQFKTIRVKIIFIGSRDSGTAIAGYGNRGWQEIWLTTQWDITLNEVIYQSIYYQNAPNCSVCIGKGPEPVQISLTTDVRQGWESHPVHQIYIKVCYVLHYHSPMKRCTNKEQQI